MTELEFAIGSVPIAVVARIYGKDEAWVRAGIVAGVAQDWKGYTERTTRHGRFAD